MLYTPARNLPVIGQGSESVIGSIMASGPLEMILRQLRQLRQIVKGELPAPLTDRHLLKRFAAQGDESALATLIERHGPMVLSVARRVLRDWHGAEDVFQATF